MFLPQFNNFWIWSGSKPEREINWNLQKICSLEFVKAHQVNLFSADFSNLELLCAGVAAEYSHHPLWSFSKLRLGAVLTSTQFRTHREKYNQTWHYPDMFVHRASSRVQPPPAHCSQISQILSKNDQVIFVLGDWFIILYNSKDPL